MHLTPTTRVSPRTRPPHAPPPHQRLAQYPHHRQRWRWLPMPGHGHEIQPPIPSRPTYHPPTSRSVPITTIHNFCTPQECVVCPRIRHRPSSQRGRHYARRNSPWRQRPRQRRQWQWWWWGQGQLCSAAVLWVDPGEGCWGRRAWREHARRRETSRRKAQGGRRDRDRDADDDQAFLGVEGGLESATIAPTTIPVWPLPHPPLPTPPKSNNGLLCALQLSQPPNICVPPIFCMGEHKYDMRQVTRCPSHHALPPHPYPQPFCPILASTAYPPLQGPHHPHFRHQGIQWWGPFPSPPFPLL